jgi:hypothetical protein
VEHLGDPEVLSSAVNDVVLGYLRDLSAHSDVAEALLEAVAPLGDVQSYCPDLSQYRYVAVATRGVVFGFAVGMATVGFRLSPEFKLRALATGAEDLVQAGPEWVGIELFRNDWPDPDLKFWALRAYVYARE